MRTKLITLIALILSVLPVNAQEVAAQPYRSYFEGWYTNWFSKQVIGNQIFSDRLHSGGSFELIDGKEYREARYWQYGSDGDYLECYFLREDTGTGKLYFYDKYARTGYSAVEYVIADMSLEIGDKFYLPVDTRFDSGFEGVEQDETGYYTEVDSVFYDENDSENRKHIRTKLRHSVTGHVMEFIEGIGSSFGFFYQKNSAYMYGELVCYESGNSEWKNIQYWDEHYPGPEETRFNCTYTTLSLMDIPPVTAVSLDIQQSKQSLVIRSDTPVNGQAILYDLPGKIQLKVDITGNDVIQMQNISPGSYIFQVLDENKKTIITEKIIL